MHISTRERLQLALAAIAAFCVYTCMFAFRKPFTAAGFAGLSFAGIDYKVWLVVAQTVGYTLAKFYGIRFIGGLPPGKRPLSILLCLGAAWLTLLLFAITPPPYGILLLIANGFPLGIVYGLVFGYLEGRRSTEVLGAVLASSFIFAAGFTQSVGKWLLLKNVSEAWMPFWAGSFFVLPALLFTYLLAKTPPPTPADEAQRTVRLPMTAADRKAFIRSFLPGIVLLVLTYVLLTIIRDYRSNFASNMWAELGLGANAAVFTQTEIPASVVTLGLLSLLTLVKSNVRALMINHAVVAAGFAVSVAATVLFQSGTLSPVPWMSAVGIGLYMGYVPFNAMLFDRLIASFRTAANAGFLIYLADAFGYLGSDAVLLTKNFLKLPVSWSGFFVHLVTALSAMGFVLTVCSALYFKKRYKAPSA